MESQIDSAADRIKPLQTPSAALIREREIASIELTRTRVLHDLSAAKHPRHRAMLEAALQHLDQQIADIRQRPETVH